MKYTIPESDYESVEEPKNKYKNTNLLILRAEHDKNFKIINLVCTQDKRLSWKAKGIHNYLITRPPYWEISVHSLEQQSTNGRDSLYSGIKELINFGYLFKIIRTNSKGQFEKRGYYSTEDPKTNEEINNLLETQAEGWQIEQSTYPEKPFTENPYQDNTYRENPLHSNEELSNKELSNKYPGLYFLNKEHLKNINKNFLQKRKNSNRKSTNVEKNKRSEFKNITYPNSKPKPKKKEYVSSEIESILSLWEGLGLKSPGKTTKSYETCIANLKQLLSGKLLDRKYTKEEVLDTIKNFALAATNLDYAPVKKDYLQGLYLYQFLHNPFSVNGDKSLFVKYFNNPPSPLPIPVRKIPLRDEAIFNTVKGWYKKTVLGGMDLEFSQQDDNNFIVASNRILEFFNKHKASLNIGIQKTPVELAKIFCEALEHSSKGRLENIEPFWLQTDKTFTIVLPKFLKSRNMLYDRSSINYNMPAR